MNMSRGRCVWSGMERRACQAKQLLEVAVSISVKVSQSCPTLCDPMDYTWSLDFFQAGVLKWVAIPFSRVFFQPRDQTQVSHTTGGFVTSWATKGSPRLLEWVTYPFSSGSSWPRNQTRVSWIAGRFFTNWATRETHHYIICQYYIINKICI